MAVGAVKGNKAEKGVRLAPARSQIIHRTVGEEIDRMALMNGLLAVLDHPVAMEADGMTMRECHPVIIVGRRAPGLAEMIFADQGGAVAGGLQLPGKGGEFANGVPVLGPFGCQPVIQPGVHTMRRRHQPGQDRGPAWRAHGIHAKGVAEPCAGGGKPVDMRCQHLVIAIAAEHVSRLVVGHDHQDVGSINHGTSESLNNFQ